MKKTRLGLCSFFLFLLFNLLYISCIDRNEPLERLDLFFLETQAEADCIVIQRDRYAVIIDAGELSDNRRIVDFLRERNIEVISNLILSFPDPDHTAAALTLLNEFKVERVIMPHFPKPSENFEHIYTIAQEKKIPLYRPIRRRYISFFRLSLVLYPPREGYYNRDNNYSLAVLGIYGKNRMLFTGDAVGKRVRELMDIEWSRIDLLKIPYHGKSGRSSADFIRKLKARYGVVFADRSDSLILEACEYAGTKIFHTGAGDWHFISNGQVLLPADEVQDGILN